MKVQINLAILLAMFFSIEMAGQNVGINTTSPNIELDVRSIDENEAATMRVANPSQSRFLELFSGSSLYPEPVVFWPSTQSLLFATNESSFTEWMRISSQGNVGIGTIDTEARLTINSFGLSDTLLLLKNTTTIGAVDYGIHFDDDNANATVGAFFNTDSTAVIAQTDCIGCDLISAIATGNTGFGRSIYGENQSSDGIGVQGANTNSYGIGVKGSVNSGGGSGIGVFGESLAAVGVGVYGEGTLYGVRGKGQVGMQAESFSPTGKGLIAVNHSNTGVTVGIQAETNSVDGYAVIGTGPGIGVYGFSSDVNPTGVGVWGIADGTSGQGLRGKGTGVNGVGVFGEGILYGVKGEGQVGVQAESFSPTGKGLIAVNYSNTGVTVGVQAETNSVDGYAVIGTGPGVGVFGSSSAANPNGYGVWGVADGISGQGLRGVGTGSSGIGVVGEGTGSSGVGIVGEGTQFGVKGEGIIGMKAESYSSTGKGIEALCHSNTGTTIGVIASVLSIEGTGVIGQGPKTGVHGFANSTNPTGYGVWGLAHGISGQGLRGEGTGSSGIGVVGEGTQFGVKGEGNIGMKAESYSPTGKGIEALCHSNTGTTIGVIASVLSTEGTGVIGQGPKTGVHGFANSTNPNGYGVWGLAHGDDGQGLRGEAIGIYGKGLFVDITSDHSSANAILAQSGGGDSYAAYLIGKVHVSGVLSKSSGSFKIDHPLDPENKYLSHSFVESPDMMNIYNGNIITDNKGNVIVTLPDYFQALNMEFRYQLTVIGEFAQAIIKEKIDGNTFKIMTDKPNIEVSWQVTGVRNDAFAKKNRIKVEEEKEATNKGKYLNPAAFGQTKEKEIGRSE